MNLNNLKPAWREFIFVNSMQQINPNEIALILEQHDLQTAGKLPRVLLNVVMFIILTTCGGG